MGVWAHVSNLLRMAVKSQEKQGVKILRIAPFVTLDTHGSGLRWGVSHFKSWPPRLTIDLGLRGCDELGGPLHSVPSEAAHRVSDDAVLFQHHRDDSQFRVVGRVALAAALGVGGKRPLELMGEAEVIHDQAAGLVFEHAVHAGDGQRSQSAYL